MRRPYCGPQETDDAGVAAPQSGYEMHLGETSGPDCARPMSLPRRRQGGAISANSLVEGCYLHGLFADDAYRRDYLKGLKGGSERMCPTPRG